MPALLGTLVLPFVTGGVVPEACTTPLASVSLARDSSPSGTDARRSRIDRKREAPPPRGGYFSLKRVGSWSRLPDDAKAAAKVRRSSWEPRPNNFNANHTSPSGLRLKPHGGVKKIWNDWLLPRISGNFSGTSDEILQWAAAKWGLPDNVLRAQMMVESQWHQATVGDCTTDQPSCPPGYTAPCPLSFGVLQVKTTPAHGGVFPHNRDSTAFNLDYAAAVIRGCYEGWEEWLRDWGYKGRGEYAAGDLWGCVGRWYSGDWHTDDTEKYLAKVRTHLHKKSWLSLQAPRGEVGLLASR